MQALAECINPDAVIITNIGDAHSEGFSSMEEKANEKALLTSASNANTVIYCADYENIDTAVDSLSHPVSGRLRWSLRGNPEAELQISAYPSAGDECRIEWRHGDKSGAFRASS